MVSYLVWWLMHVRLACVSVAQLNKARSELEVLSQEKKVGAWREGGD